MMLLRRWWCEVRSDSWCGCHWVHLSTVLHRHGLLLHWTMLWLVCNYWRT